MNVNLHPRECNLCGGKVIYVSNEEIYGRTYGSGWCYLCTKCGSYTGTHRPRPHDALGLLADRRMRKGKVMCHMLFDAHWQPCKKKHKYRNMMYAWLAAQLHIPMEECHFGYFDIDTLLEAYRVLKGVEGKKAICRNGEIIKFG